jgi:hypothetical protein
MPTLEPDFAQAESIILDAAPHGQLNEQQAQRIEAFYRNAQSRYLNLYDGARLGAWRIYDREKVAGYWKEQTDWFSAQRQFIENTKAKVSALGIAAPPVLGEAIQTLTEIIEACAGAYELHA